MFDTYPFPEIQAIRDNCGVPPIERHLKVPTLARMCSNLLACRDRSSDPDNSMIDLSVYATIRQHTYYIKYPPDHTWVRNARAATLQQNAERNYLARTTLVIVPPILVDQWIQEIKKHVEPETLKVLVVGSEELPDVYELMEYDVSVPLHWLDNC